MKKFVCVLVALLMVVGLAIFLPSKSADSDYFCLQIYANSNSAIDQGVKYQIKNELVNYLTPYLKSAKDKPTAIKMVKDINISIVNVCKKVLTENNLKYPVNVKISNNYFEKTENLEGGFYDSIVVELGAATGKNENCLIYPPLNLAANKNVKFKSKIFGWLKSVFD